METTVGVWTNEDRERRGAWALFSSVGQPAGVEKASPAATPSPYVAIHDSEWYAEEAATLRGELERRQARLTEYQRALEDVRSLQETTGGINLDEGDVGITPEAGIEILWQRVEEHQSQPDVIEDLPRLNDIEPGVLRGQ